MKHFDYNIICEDVAHQTFIDEFLKIVSVQNPELTFALHEQCYYTWRFSNKADVLKYYQEVSVRSFKDYNIHLLFVVADFDDWVLDEFNDYHKNLHDGLQDDIKDKSFVLLPVRAIEFWLWHLQYLRDNPNSTKNVSIDNEKRSEIKRQIYGTKKPHKELSKSKVIEWMKYYNEDWLISRSPSFNHFLERFRKVIS